MVQQMNIGATYAVSPVISTTMAVTASGRRKKPAEAAAPPITAKKRTCGCVLPGKSNQGRTTMPTARPRAAPHRRMAPAAPPGADVPTATQAMANNAKPYTSSVGTEKCMSSDTAKRLLSVVPCPWNVSDAISLTKPSGQVEIFQLSRWPLSTNADCSASVSARQGHSAGSSTDTALQKRATSAISTSRFCFIHGPAMCVRR
mmetsp:Transcript_17397/g.48047  ORF Transcript_17397/g.48047 Transcript_17397/m.48047 type:complete len:202 (+) Transcript_17397:806-1411(+)